jgi:MtrB/PioB family decaheme-associated outer membrane protein
MRTRIMILSGALLVASTVSAQAQDTKPASTQPPATTGALPSLGTIDFGYRGTSFTGDEARYNRYRDLRDGVYADRFRFAKESETTAFRFEANNVGYRDQRYMANVQSIGKLKANFTFNSNPLYQVNARGYFSGAGSGTLTIDDAAQQAIQTSALNAESALATYGHDYKIESRRDTANFNLTYTATRDLDVKVQVRNTNRTGSNLQDFGFGSSPGNVMVLDMPVPVDDRTTDLKTNVEWANKQGLLSVGWFGSWYNQSNPAFRFDNPQRVSDSPSAGPALGQAALMPSNSFNTFNVNGAYKLPGRSRATAAISYGVMDQNESLLPNTVNTALVNVGALPRGTADAKVDVTSMLFGFNTRPAPEFLVDAKFRYYDYNNKTEPFTNNVVTADYTVGAIETSEPTAFNRKTFDLDASYAPLANLGVAAGYTYEGYDNHIANETEQARPFSGTQENTFRLSADSTGNQYVTARFKYEHSSRTAQNFDQAILVDLGEQTGMRHFDIAPRDRDRVTGIFDVTPVEKLDVNASVFYGHDKYPDTAPVDSLNPAGETFGLRDNKNKGYTVGFDVIPNAMVSFGANFGQEKYDTFQYSRTANPLSATNQDFLDPRRDWSDTINDKTNTYSVYLNLTKAIDKTDIRLGYDVSDGNTLYTYGLVPNTTIAAPVQYNTQPKNKLEVFKINANYFIRPNVALGAAYWYENWSVQDFALDPAIINALIVRNPSNNALTGFYTGYANEPYKANTFFVRMRYLW